MAVELWLHAFSFPHRVAELARQAEEWGFAGLLLADSQNLNADIWVELALAGAATSRLRLGPGVTNPVTRHLAVTASAAATLQLETDGRAVLGLGRGDSAVTQIGRKPVPASELERALVAIQGYLRGEEVFVDAAGGAIRWIAESRVPKVPVEVAATGPRTIAAAARHAEGVDFAVGAEPQRLRWAIQVARRASDGRELSLGAFINVAVHPRLDVARELVRGSVAIFARFATEGAPPDGLSDVTKGGIEQLASGYEKESHGEGGTAFAQRLGGDFIDRFAVAGPPAHVRNRLTEIAEAGIDRVIVVPGSLDADPGAMEESNRRFAQDVLPQLIS
jgi:5,10-methylenetetrahydromethanopterin reductase